MKEKTAAKEAKGGTGVLLVGVGGIGCELAAKCRPARVRRLVDFDHAAMDDYDAAEVLRLGGGPEDTDDMSPEAMRHAAEEAATTLAEAAQRGCDLAVFIGAIGGQTGSIVLPILASEVQSAGCTVLVIAVQPLPFEGASRANVAARTIAALERSSDLILTVPNRPVGDLCDAALPIDQALECLKQRTAEAVGQLLDALSDESCVGLQPADLRRALSEAGRGAFGVGVGRGERRVEDALRDACGNSFLTQEICQQASSAILHLRGAKNISLQEVYSATDLVATLVGHVPIQAGLSTDGTGDEVHATLLVTGIRPPRPTSGKAESLAGLSQFEDLSTYDGENLDVPTFIRRQAARVGQ
jgi:cell division protein FtsZ